MADTNHITKKYLNEIFEYKDGMLYRKKKFSNRSKIGRAVGAINFYGYYDVNINYKTYKVHRLIFLMHHGYMPMFIDHIDNNRLNNCINNLREVTKIQNNQNTKLRFDNKLQIKGVYYNKKAKKFMVTVTANKKRIYLGLYEDIELAELVAIMAREKYHGNFANHG